MATIDPSLRNDKNSAVNTPRILLSAFGVHAGGGMVLLCALAAALRSRLKAAILDARVEGMALFANNPAIIRYARKNFLSRLTSLMHLSSSAVASDILLCFNSLPPIRRPACRVVVYVHAPHFANLHRGIRYTLLTTLRIFIERCWFKLGIANCDEIWVQTGAMAAAMREEYPQANVVVVPFVDDELFSKLSAHSSNLDEAALPAKSEYIFFYPADAVGHKNHPNLLKAWLQMNQIGLTPKLLLTLTDEEFESVYVRAGIRQDILPNVVNLGRLSRDKVLEHMITSSGMIFPSLAETFGLPMLEARSLGVPILAAERDFVRDVCTPTQTFDPLSSRSIAAAVCRFMRHPSADNVPILNAEKFLDFLIEARPAISNLPRHESVTASASPSPPVC